MDLADRLRILSPNARAPFEPVIARYFRVFCDLSAEAYSGPTTVFIGPNSPTHAELSVQGSKLVLDATDDRLVISGFAPHDAEIRAVNGHVDEAAIEAAIQPRLVAVRARTGLA